MLLDKFLYASEKILNRYLAADPEKAADLESEVGKTLTIILLPFHQSFFIRILNGPRLHITQTTSMSGDLIVTATPLALLGLLKNHPGALPKNVTLQGDLRLAQLLKKVFREIDIDWEEQLSHYVGDFWAVTISKPWRRFARWQQHATHSLQRQISEYLQEEAQHLPARTALEAFYEEVDTLRDAVERLSVQVNLLSAGE